MLQLRQQKLKCFLSKYQRYRKYNYQGVPPKYTGAKRFDAIRPYALYGAINTAIAFSPGITRSTTNKMNTMIRSLFFAGENE